MLRPPAYYIKVTCIPNLSENVLQVASGSRHLGNLHEMCQVHESML